MFSVTIHTSLWKYVSLLGLLTVPKWKGYHRKRYVSIPESNKIIRKNWLAVTALDIVGKTFPTLGLFWANHSFEPTNKGSRLIFLRDMVYLI